LKAIVPIPVSFSQELKWAGEIGIAYQIVAVELRDGRGFDQVAISEGCLYTTPFRKSTINVRAVSRVGPGGSLCR
jgi:hypothetical protein